MTNETVSAKLDATLRPLESIRCELDSALSLAQRGTFPAPFIATLKGALADLDNISQTIDDAATALDPDRAKHKL